MIRTQFLAALALCAGAVPQSLLAQVTFSDWQSTGGGAYDDTSNWLGGVAPEGAMQGARFQSNGFAQQDFLMPNDRTLEVDGMEFLYPAGGLLKLMPEDPTGDAFITVNGTLLKEGGNLTLDRLGVSIEMHVQATQTVLAGGSLNVQQSSSLTSTSTELRSAAEATLLWLEETTTSSLGQVRVGETGTGGAGAELLVDRRSEVSAGDINVATTGGIDAIHRLSINGVLTQAPTSSVVIGADSETGIGRGILSNSGQLINGTGGLTIAQNGQFFNNGGHIEFGGDFTVIGGFYRENTPSTRSFATDAVVTASAGAELLFNTADLQLLDGQRLDIDNAYVEINSGADLVLGESSTVVLSSNAALPSDPTLVVTEGEAQLAGALELNVVNSILLAEGSTLPLIRAASFSGALSIAEAPSLPSGLAWELQVLEGVLSATVVEATISLPGDYNQDGMVDSIDYAVWRSSLGSETELAADGDGSLKIDQGDFAVWLEHFGSASPTASRLLTPAPEPGALTALLGLAHLVMAGSLRQRGC